jgi:hypothetical protein
MVRISDEEKSTFDAPVETVWKYLQHPEAHGGAHRGSRNRTMTPVSDTSFIISWEQNLNGNWVKFSNKITVFPPLGMASEQLEGPMAGSRMFTIYTPRGSKTEVTVHGEMVSPTTPPAQLEQMVRSAWENAYNEDAAGIREFAAKK